LGGRDGKVRTDLLTYPRRRTWNASGGTSSPDALRHQARWVHRGGVQTMMLISSGDQFPEPAGVVILRLASRRLRTLGRAWSGCWSWRRLAEESFSVAGPGYY
jgi:hypothetical protein